MKHFVRIRISAYLSNTSIVRYACILLVTLPILSSCSTYRIDRSKYKSYKEWKTFQWTEIKKSSDNEVAEWIIYSRKVKGTNFFEYKIEGEIESTPESCVSAFVQDIYEQANNDENKKYPTYDIVNETSESILTYVIHNEPFPFRDTEMSVKYLLSNNELGDAAVVWHEAWDESIIQPTKKLHRVETFRGSWEFFTVSENKTKAINTVQFDPKKMPKWLVKPMVVGFLKNGLEKIRQTILRS